MDKYKYLAKNSVIFFIGSFASKILVFLLLPLYTTVLTTSEYAISDLMSTSVHLLCIVMTLMLSEAVLRFSIEKKHENSEVLGIGIMFVIFSTILLGIGIILIASLKWIKIFDGYWVYFLLLYFFYSLNQLMAGFTRGAEKVKLIAIAGVAGTVTTVTINILLLVVFKYGIKGYIISMIASNALMCLIYFLFGGVSKYIKIRRPDSALLIEMVQYSIPIVFTEIAWWINSASDRYIVTWLLGPSETGLLSAAHRLPSMLTIFTGIFMQAWKLSAIKEYGQKSSQAFFSKMLNSYNALLVMAASVIIALVKIISSFIFRGEFIAAWRIVPPFILAFAINGVSAFLGTFFVANKNTKTLMSSTLFGAVLNIALCCLLILEVGTIGAGIAASISYFCISVIRVIQVKRQISLHIEVGRILASYSFLILLTVFVSMEIKYVGIISLLIVVIVVIINFKYVGQLKNLLKSIIINRKDV